MRRFELSDGTSDKFWQVARSGCDVQVHFGRIGTNGQAQTKSFSTAELAQTELDKLVKEKLKKGYREVGEGASTTPAPPAPTTPKVAKAATAPVGAKPAAPKAPETAATEVAAVVESAPPVVATTPGIPRVQLSAHALREVAPIRGSSIAVARKPDAKALFAKLSKAMADAAPILDPGELRPAELPEVVLTKAARAAFAADAFGAPLDLEAQAAAFALIGPPTNWGGQHHADEFVAYWQAREGAAFALRAFVRAAELHVDGNNQRVVLVAAEPAFEPYWRTLAAVGWRALRSVVAFASEDEHQALLAEAEHLARAASPKTRAALAAAFERPAWCSADVATMPTASQTPSWFWPLLVSCSSLEEATALLARAQLSRGWEQAHAFDKLRFDFVARYGADVRSLLIETLEKVGEAGVELLRSLAEALAMIDAPEVATFFVSQLGGKDLRAIAGDYLLAYPETSVAPLALAAAVGKGATSDAARAVLRAIVAANDVTTFRSYASISPAAQQLVASLAEATRAKVEASPDHLPLVLRAPPWTTRKAAVAAPKVIELALLPFAESISWRTGEPQAWLSGTRHLDEEPEKVDEHLDTLRCIESGLPLPQGRRWGGTAGLLCVLPGEALLRVADSVDVLRLTWFYWPFAKVLVARHGVAVIGLVLRSSARDALGAIAALVRANSPRVAPLMAEGFVRLKKAKDDATRWLVTFPEAAAVGLIPLALSKPSSTRDLAERALRFVSTRGDRATIEAVAARYGDAALAGIREVLDYDPLQAFPARLPKLPSFWTPAAFSRPLLADGTRALPVAAVDAIGTMLAFTSFDDPYVGLLEVRDACDRRSLADFAWDLFQAWIVAGAPSKESWAFLALGIFGDDETARRLTPLIRAWPGESAHARAVTGLDVLAKIGTDVALMHLHGIAQKLKFKALQEKAREKIDQIAEARGLTAEELADRLVPDLGLDERGSLSLDFGPRQFRVVFDESLKPAVLDADGKRLPDLPKPKQSDDEAKAKEATETWKALKKDAKTIASGQLLRLEVAMCAQRRWSREVFTTFLVEHPLLVHVVRRIVWGSYGDDERLLATFRLAEDGTFADASDGTFELAPDARVGIAHRLDLDDATAAAWGQIFADYEVLQPFAQLSREVILATEAERAATTIERVFKLKVPTGKVLGLDGRGWRRGTPQDAGIVPWYEKPLAGGLVACLDLDPGIFTGAVSEAPEQTLGGLTLTEGRDGWSVDAARPFSSLSPIAFSELLRDLESLRP